MRASFFVSISTVAGIFSAMNALSCASSDDNFDAVRRATSAAVEAAPFDSDSDATSEIARTEPVKTNRLYFDTDRRVRLGETGKWRFTFDAQSIHPFRVAILGADAPLKAILYRRDSLSSQWKAIESVEGAETELTDTPKSARAYRVDVTGPTASWITLRLTCDGELHVTCAVKRQPGDDCGGLAAGLTKCDSGLFCNMVKDTCGYADQGGLCTEPPEMCTMIWKPVCGCDGKTYGNACVAASVRASVSHDGECAN